MATVTQQDIAPLHKQLYITINKEDYLPSLEKNLKDYSKKANIPGFRKGMVPSGLIRKMYGASLLTDEVLKALEKQVGNFIETEKLDIFAQPLPVDLNLSRLDVNKPEDYNFVFEVGLKPDFVLPDFTKQNIKRFKIQVTEEMVTEEVERLHNRYGNITEPETVTNDENVLNVIFKETDTEGTIIQDGIKKENSLLVKYFKEDFRNQLKGKSKDDILDLQLQTAFEEKERELIAKDLEIESNSDKHFKLHITKIGLVEKRELNEEFFKQLFPNDQITSEEDLRGKIKDELQLQWESESRNQLQHQLYHVLLEQPHIDFPEDFLKRWMRTQGQDGKQKTDDEVENEFPTFINQLKWTLITDKISQQNNLQVEQDDIRQFAKQQLLGYMGMQTLNEEQQWVIEYIDKMMKDKKYVEDAYHRLLTQKIFEWAETQVKTVETMVTKEEFIAMNNQHQHQHH